MIEKEATTLQIPATNKISHSRNYIRGPFFSKLPSKYLIREIISGSGVKNCSTIIPNDRKSAKNASDPCHYPNQRNLSCILKLT